MNLSQKLLEVCTPYYGEFKDMRVFTTKRDFSESKNIGRDRYIIGSGADGRGLYYSYNLTAIPVKVTDSRISKLLGRLYNGDFASVEKEIVENLCERYAEIIIS